MTSTAEIPGFPMTRAAGCPFDPPPAGRALQGEAPLARVRLWDGSTPWLVTRYAEQRALLADPRVSADITRPGYPSPAPLPKGGTGISFILLDNPERARRRKVVTPPFPLRGGAGVRPAVQKIGGALADELLAGPKPVDLVEAFA